MATKSVNLGLILPAFSEYYNNWNVPMNANFVNIDNVLGAVQEEVVAARGNATDLNTRISTVISADGTLNPVPEVVNARSSSIYGVQPTLEAALYAGDVEVWYARASLSTLLDSLAWAADDVKNNSVVSGPTNPLTYSGAIVTLNGGTTPVLSNINGYRQAVRTNPEVTISGASGVYYLTLTRVPGGTVYNVDVSGSGTTSLDPNTNYLSIFTASATNYVTLGVKPGDILRITGPSGNVNIGDYVITQTNNEDPTNLATNQLRVAGQFISAVGGLNSSLVDILRPTLGFTGSQPPGAFVRQNGFIYIGSLMFDGTNVTGLTPFAYQGRYSAWLQVTLVSGNYSVNFAHNLGYIPKSFTLYASQANDFSQPLEPMSIAGMTEGSVSLTAGDQTVTYISPTQDHSALAQVTTTSVIVQNTANGVFYTDFSGNPQTSGYLYLAVER